MREPEKPNSERDCEEHGPLAEIGKKRDNWDLQRALSRRVNVKLKAVHGGTLA